MNERFVCVKVDREERPDVDAMCMEAVQAMTGRGGWPLNAFLSPELVPFYAGTYFPPESGRGMPSWRMVLEAVADAWTERRDQIRRQGADILRVAVGEHPARALARADPRRARGRRHRRRSRAHTTARTAASGPPPKFPQASVIELLLVRGEREMSLHTLEAMARGGYLRPGRRRVRALRRRRDLDGPPLREDALRQRAAGAGLPARVAGLGQRSLRARLPRDARLGAARDAWPRGRVLLGARRRLRRSRGEVLRVERRPSCERCSVRRSPDEAIAYFGATEQGNFERGLNVLTARGPEPDGARRRSAASCSRPARSASGRGSTTSG